MKNLVEFSPAPIYIKLPTNKSSTRRLFFYPQMAMQKQIITTKCTHPTYFRYICNKFAKPTTCFLKQ